MLRVTENDGWKYGSICSVICRASSCDFAITPSSKPDINSDGQIDAADDVLVDSGDDFGFNEGIEFL